MAIVPKTSAAAAKVNVSFRMKPSSSFVAEDWTNTITALRQHTLP
jgi:hypothetical protein